MRAPNTANVLLGLFVVLGSIALYHVAGTFEGDARDRAFPQLLLILAGVVGVALVTREFWQAKKILLPPWSFSLSRRQLFIVLVSSTYPLVAFPLGFYLSAFLFLTLFPWIVLRTAPVTSSSVRRGEGLRLFIKGMAAAGLFVVFLYVSFWHLLRFSFPQGVWL